MQRPGEENKLEQRSCNFQKLPFSLLKFSDQNNIAKLVLDMWGNCSKRFNIFYFAYILENL